MNLNNEVRDYQDKIIGFRCFQCGGVYQTMWENTCNNCRAKESEHNEMIKEIKQLKDEIKKLNNNRK